MRLAGGGLSLTGERNDPGERHSPTGADRGCEKAGGQGSITLRRPTGPDFLRRLVRRARGRPLPLEPVARDAGAQGGREALDGAVQLDEAHTRARAQILGVNAAAWR